jgi:2-C-methyl-D-erythritol 4-phosphate cytidylyltransferase
MKEYAIVVAGGSGKRMDSALPKQFIPLLGRPVLMHTLEAFYNYDSSISIVLALPEQQIGFWRSLCEKHEFNIYHQVTAGGATRFQSVKNALKLVDQADSMVSIHDGVRPLVPKELIDASFRLAALHGSAVAAVRLKESIRKIDQASSKAIDRSALRLVQTPQTFQYHLIKDAYDIQDSDDITDDAMVAEKAGVKISLFEGSYENIKITTPEDMIVAEAILKQRK